MSAQHEIQIQIDEELLEQCRMAIQALCWAWPATLDKTVYKDLLVKLNERLINYERTN